MRTTCRIATIGAVLFLVSASAFADGWFDHNRAKRGSGDVIEEVRELESFDRISLKCSADVYIKRGETQRVAVLCDDNLLDNVLTQVRGDRLVIDIKGSIWTREGIELEIIAPSLTRIDVSGSGNVIVEDVKEKQFEIRVSGSGDIDVEGELGVVEISVSGSGDIDLDGTAEEIAVRISGSGDVDARSLRTRIADVRIVGSGDVAVYASELFDGTISGSGDIYVYGDPPDTYENSRGSGDIHFR